MSDDQRCSLASATLGEPMAGSAATSRSWVCLEQPGPWGRDALVDNHLADGVGAKLAEAVEGTGVRMVLIRRPGRHADRHQPGPHRVYLAHTAPGDTWLERTDVLDPTELLDLDFAAIGAGERPGVGAVSTDPVLVVCTNGRRDVCCALYGRPIAIDLAARHGDTVWEGSHLGGHRFSPTALLLPTGYAYGRLDTASAAALLTGPGVVTDRCRGRSTWTDRGQVAELRVRELIGEHHPDAVRVDASTGGDVLVRHRDGRGWTVTVVVRAFGPDRAASCGKAPTPATELHVAAVTEIGA
jgi:hypothetical protein